MEIPKSTEIIVSPDRIIHYLLDIKHPVTKFRAEFISRMEGDREHLYYLREQIEKIPKTYPPIKTQCTYKVGFVYKFTFVSNIKFQGKYNQFVKTYWICKPYRETLEFLTLSLIH